MQNIIFGLIMTFLLVPGSVFAATGAAGTVETQSAGLVDASTASLNASVFAYYPGTTLFFEYGPTTAFGYRTYGRGMQEGTASVGSMKAFSLTPNVMYYYRAVIEGTGGTVYGDTRTFFAGGQNDAAYATQNTSNTNGVANTNTTNGSTGSTQTANTTQTAGAANAFGNTTGGQTQNGSIFGQNQNPGGFFQRLFDSFTRSRPVQLSVAMNPEKPKAREIVEYSVTYANTSNQSIGKGELAVVLPDSVVYLADNSGGRTTLSKVTGGQQLVMNTDPLSGKEKRTITVMAVAGSAVAKAVPTAVAGIGYLNAQGTSQYLSTNKAEKATPLVAAVGAANTGVSQASTETSSGGDSSGGILPNTFFEWLVFLGVVTGIIVIIRKVLAVYQERKKRILEESSREVIPAHG